MFQRCKYGLVEGEPLPEWVRDLSAFCGGLTMGACFYFLIVSLMGW